MTRVAKLRVVSPLAVACALLVSAASLAAQNRDRELTLAIGGAVVSRALDRDARKATIIRADLFASSEQAAQYALMKARQVIDEQGALIFERA